MTSVTELDHKLQTQAHPIHDDRIVVTPEAAAVGESSAGLAAGDEMSFGDAIKAVLTASGNDAASAVAHAAGAVILGGRGQDGGAAAREAAFVEAMNAKAPRLRLTITQCLTLKEAFLLLCRRKCCARLVGFAPRSPISSVRRPSRRMGALSARA